MDFELDSALFFYIFVAVAVILVAEAGYLLFFSTTSYRKNINRRLFLLDGKADREATLVQLRRERGMTGDGDYLLPIQSLNRLIMQSGLAISLVKLTMFAAFGTLLVFGATLSVGGGWMKALLAAFGAGLVFPYLAVVIMRGRRLKKFGAQFPDAIDVIVRSLRAGHPVPIAISMVAREFKDPVGTEFGMAADEITYGADLESAMRSLYIRVGQDDLPLFITAVAIQGSTGGNLGEILENLSAVIRQRFKMRRKVKALAAEARASALILSALPIGMFGIIQVVAPDFYGSVWQFDVTQVALGCAGAWMLVGNLIMYRMVNFKI